MPIHIDLTRLNRFIACEAPEWSGVHTATAFKGGQSNPTFRLGTPRGDLVLRMKPPGWSSAHGHDVGREFRVLSALQATDVPVPKTYVHCDDVGVIGCEFYLMEFVEGRVVDNANLPGFTPAERTAIFRDLVRVIAALHRLNWQALGLGDYGKPDGYVARQIAIRSRLHRDHGEPGIADIEWLIDHLPTHVPRQTRTSLVHADVRVGNMMLHPTEPRIIAVLDWELSTLGDPLADAALLPLPHLLPPMPLGDFQSVDTKALGIPSTEQIIAWYCADMGLDSFPDLDFMLAFNLFRYATVNHQIVMACRKGIAESDFEDLYGPSVDLCARTARALIERLSRAANHEDVRNGRIHLRCRADPARQGSA